METEVNHCNQYRILFAIALGLAIIFVFASGCLGRQTPVNATIADILANPAAYEGKTVVVGGQFGGWGGNFTCDNEGDMAMLTKSDAILYNGTSCIYMVARADGEVRYLYQEGNVSPTDRSTVGTRLTVQAQVSLIDGKPILGKVD